MEPRHSPQCLKGTAQGDEPEHTSQRMPSLPGRYLQEGFRETQKATGGYVVGEARLLRQSYFICRVALHFGREKCGDYGAFYSNTGRYLLLKALM